ncbi:MAG: UDP-N-acetylglucosamine 1-carboxyvinyltransferase [Pleomorphochaeta sp.]
MSSYIINGGNPVKGEITASGNKNAALPLLAATLLTDEEIILKNVPDIKDVQVMCNLLKSLGSSVNKIENNILRIKSGNRKGLFDKNQIGLVRGSILFMGPLLATLNKVILPPPGGDVIGLRRIDTHFKGFSYIGCESYINSDGNLSVECKKLKSNHIFLDEASVTATENMLMACALNTNESIIENAACEPHVQDLCKMLVIMGCKIEGIGSNLIKIVGAKKLKGCEYKISCDYMEVGSLIGLAGATKGSLLIKGVDDNIYNSLALGFNKIGIEFSKKEKGSIYVPKMQQNIIKKSLSGLTNKVDDAPWPGFPADLLSILSVCATQMKGTILLHEKMFESRMFFIDWLIRMGADIILCDPHRVIVNGPTSLKPAIVSSPDVRAGMALVIAAACCNGISEIQNIYQIERGYENLEQKLGNIGVDIIKKV